MDPEKIVNKYFDKDYDSLSNCEKRAIDKVANRQIISKNINTKLDDDLTFGQKVADKVAKFGGSWSFIFICLIVLISWMTFNSCLFYSCAFDPFPFILLNLILSTVAALQAPIIMMSQNRINERERLDAKHHYEKNLKMELEVMSLHAKIDRLLADDEGFEENITS